MEQLQENEYSEEYVNKRTRRDIAVIWVISILFAVILTAALTGYFTWIASQNQHQEEEGLLVTSLKEARDIIRQNYFYYDENEQKMTDAVLKGLAAGTGDSYAEYYTKDEYEELTRNNQRNFVGIGILTALDDLGRVEILDVYDGTPAQEAGLEPGDYIMEINGVAHADESLSEFLSNMRSEDGAKNTYVILRGQELLTFEIVAREVHTPSVSYRMLTDTIGYIHVQAFHGTCVDETKAAMKTLREAGMQKLVLDFRDNLGGSLYDAIDIADIFLPKNYIVTTLRSRNGDVREYKTSQSGIDIQIALLVNEYSASASELVAGALKDYGAAYLIGTKTYGKGIVQTFFEIPETHGWMKITTDAYFTPNGVCVQDEGITPDRIVTLSDEAQKYSIDRIPPELDTQLLAAIAYLEE